jgi:hypothetical protein
MDLAAVALKPVQLRTPDFLSLGPFCNPFGDQVFVVQSNFTLAGAEEKTGTIDLKGSMFNDPPVTLYKAFRIMHQSP